MSLLLLGILALASTEETSAAGSESERNIFFLPSIAYTPRTSLLLGAGMILSFEDEELDTALQSSFTGFGYYTIRNQWGLGANAEIYFSQDRWLLLSTLNLFDGVSFFFGVGDNPRDRNDRSEFDTINLFGDVALLRCIYDTLFLGVLLRAQDYRATNVDDAELGALPGSGDGSQLGAGVRAVWDRRDRALWTRSGAFFRGSLVFYDDHAASDFTMSEVQLDGRAFLPLGHDWVVGIQGVVDVRRGNVPFFRQALIGGPDRLRGTFAGRFRDDASWYAQSEVRSPVFWWRLAAVGFAGAGAVAPRFSGLTDARHIVVAGGGVRIGVGEDGANVRMDYGFGSDRERAFYISLGEAF
ncbi:MAG: BamA/TamA family outer membrane protein [Myxococcota bacterium]